MKRLLLAVLLILVAAPAAAHEQDYEGPDGVSFDHATIYHQGPKWVRFSAFWEGGSGATTTEVRFRTNQVAYKSEREVLYRCSDDFTSCEEIGTGYYRDRDEGDVQAWEIGVKKSLIDPGPSIRFKIRCTDTYCGWWRHKL